MSGRLLDTVWSTYVPTVDYLSRLIDSTSSCQILHAYLLLHKRLHLTFTAPYGTDTPSPPHPPYLLSPKHHLRDRHLDLASHPSDPISSSTRATFGPAKEMIPRCSSKSRSETRLHLDCIGNDDRAVVGRWFVRLGSGYLPAGHMYSRKAIVWW
jgi:hypothetical protein